LVPTPPQHISPPVVKKLPSPPKATEPLKVDQPKVGQPSSVASVSSLIVPVVVDSPKRVSPKVLRQSPKTFSEAVMGTATVTTKCPNPLPKIITAPSVSLSRKEHKLREDPERARWIARRRVLEDEGADLSALSIGREDVADWWWTGGGSKNFYVVWSGRKVGVFQGWDLTKSLVSGFGGAGYKKVSTAKEGFELLEKHLLSVFGE